MEIKNLNKLQEISEALFYINLNYDDILNASEDSSASIDSHSTIVINRSQNILEGMRLIVGELESVRQSLKLNNIQRYLYERALEDLHSCGAKMLEFHYMYQAHAKNSPLENLQENSILYAKNLHKVASHSAALIDELYNTYTTQNT